MKRTLSVFIALSALFVLTSSICAQGDPGVDRLAAEGVRTYEAGNYAEAEKLFLQGIALEDQKNINPLRRSQTNYLYLSNIYAFIKKDRAKGDAIIQKLLSLDKSSAGAYRGYALSIFEKNKLDQTVIEFLTEAILLEPQNPENYYQRALALKKFPGLALGDLERAIKADPKFALAYEERGRIYMSQGEYAAAAADYEKFYSLLPNEGAFYFVNHGMAVLFKGDTNAAIGDFTKFIASPAFNSSPLRAIAHYYRGYANLLNRNRAAAQADMLEAGRLDAKFKSFWHARLAAEPEEKCRGEKKTDDEVDDAYKKLKSLSNSEFQYQVFKLRFALAVCEPGSPTAIFKLINRTPSDDADIDNSNLQKYLRALAPAAAQRDPNLPDVVTKINGRLGIDTKAHLMQSTDPNWKYVALRDQTTNIYPAKTAAENIAAAQKAIAGGRYHFAIALANRALESEPGNIQLQEERMRAFVNKGARIRAFDEAQKILKVNPQSFVALNIRGMVNEYAGRKDEALADYTAAIAANPKFDRAYFNRGQSYLGRNKPDLALKDFNQAVDLNKESGLYLTHRGHANYALKDYRSAERDYLTVVTVDPANYDARVGLINSFDRDGDPASKKLADFHHAWLIQNASDYAGLKTLANRNTELAGNVTFAAARNKAVDDITFYSDKVTEGYENYRKSGERYQRPNVLKEQQIKWLETDLRSLAVIIKDTDKFESEAKRILADTSLKLSGGDVGSVKATLQNVISIRGYCREHIAEINDTIAKMNGR